MNELLRETKKSLFEVVRSEIKLNDEVTEGAKNKNVIGALTFDFNDADKENANKRIYSSELWKDALPKFNKKLDKGAISSQLDHPSIADGSFGSELSKVSHVLVNTWFDSEKKKAMAQSLILNTQAGNDLKTMILAGTQLGASSRGTGTVGAGNKIEGFELIGIDIVSTPSSGSMITKANLHEAVQLCRLCKLEEATLKERFSVAKISYGFIGNFEDYKEMLAVDRKREAALSEKYRYALASGFSMGFEAWKKTQKK